ncbi:TetR/AcrR family transcriptional regulator [Actinocrispum wychmicini]|nr:TetR/AcrR family transcriptional regulator [Actinocrispum wychmicini]
MSPAIDVSDRRHRLLRAAGELFAERPYDQVTTVAIAKRAHVAYGLIAHHFGNKRGLYLATIEHAANSLREARAAVLDQATDPVERLRLALDRHIAYAEDNAAGFLAVLRGGLGADDDVQDIIETLQRGVIQQILDEIGATEPYPPVLRTVMRGWLGYFNEVVIDHLRHRDVPRATLVDLAVSAFRTAVATALDTGDVAIDPRIAELLDGRSR